MNKIEKCFRNQKLLRQIGVAFVFQIIIITVINTILVYRNNMDMYIEERTRSSLNLAEYLSDYMENRDDTSWLISYWREHDADMDITYDDTEATKQRLVQLKNEYPDMDFSNMSVDLIEKQTPEFQKEYAEYSYMQMTDVFNDIKRTFHPTFVFCFYPKSDTELYYYINGTEENEKRGDTMSDIYHLGTISQYDSSAYPVLKKVWETGEVPDELEQPEKTGELSGYYHLYVPVMDGDKIQCVVAVTLETNTIKQEIQHKLGVIAGIGVGGFVLIGLVLMYIVHGVVIKPVSVMRKGMMEYETNKLGQVVKEELAPIVSNSEIGNLAAEFTQLTSEIDRHVNDIKQYTMEQEYLKAELGLAARIQLDMLPKEYPDRTDVCLCGIMEPAKEVGGDFYDFFFVDEDHLALVIGDVSGKGVPASLFMMRSMTVIRNYAMMGLSVEEIFTRSNNELCRANASELFTTSWFGIYEISTGRLLFTDAGHDNPFCIRKNGEIEMICPQKKRTILGCFENIQYLQNEISLYSGDTLVLYTDGVPEANNEKEELYGIERFKQSIERHRHTAGSDIAAFTEEIRADIRTFVGNAEQFDDLTLLTFGVPSSDKKEFEIQMEANEENLPIIFEEIEKQVESLNIPGQNKIMVSVDEVLANITDYSKASMIHVKLCCDKHKIKFVFEDDGVEFNPLEKNSPSGNVLDDGRNPGGFGIYIVRNTMDDVTYQRQQGKNVLSFEKNIG